MIIIGIIIWIAALLWAILHGMRLREHAREHQSTEHTFELHALLLAVSVIIVPILSVSPLHLLWMMPAAYIIGLASIIPPLSLLWIPASAYGALWYVGTRDAGLAFYRSGEYDKAVTAFREAIKNGRRTRETHFYLALAYSKLGDHKAAVDELKEAVRLDPNYQEAFCNLGFIYRDIGLLDESVTAFRSAIHIYPEYPRALFNLGKVLIQQERLDDAKHVYGQLSALDKQAAKELSMDIEALNMRGIV